MKLTLVNLKITRLNAAPALEPSTMQRLSCNKLSTVKTEILAKIFAKNNHDSGKKR